MSSSLFLLVLFFLYYFAAVFGVFLFLFFDHFFILWLSCSFVGFFGSKKIMIDDNNL
jgi:hypothetical protein